MSSSTLTQSREVNLEPYWLLGFCESWPFSSADDVGSPQVAGANCVYLLLGITLHDK